jgi:hypothetical protein
MDTCVGSQPRSTASGVNMVSAVSLIHGLDVRDTMNLGIDDTADKVFN